MKRSINPTVVFNASVILAGINSPTGASGNLLKFVKAKKIRGVISELIENEVLRHAGKIGKSPNDISLILKSIMTVVPAPKKTTVTAYESIVTDFGNAHVLATAKETKADYLVSLDKKHILILNNHIRDYHILSSGELIILIRKS